MRVLSWFGILLLFALLGTFLDQWYHVFIVGKYYESGTLFLNMFMGLLPVGLIAAFGYAAFQLEKFGRNFKKND